jgi:hypothetical protein
MRVTVAHETSTLTGLEHRRFEHPEVLLRTAELEDRLRVDTLAVCSLREEQELSVRYVFGLSLLQPHCRHTTSIQPKQYVLL